MIGRPCEVDESRVCGSPGKVVDATHLHRMLQTSAKEQLYYGTGNFSYFNRVYLLLV